MPDPVDDAGLMSAALATAVEARLAGELPYGAVVASPSHAIIGRCHDGVVSDRDPTSHAEILAVRAAIADRGPDLSGCALVSTVEPCAMCFSAAWTAGVSRLVFALSMDALRVRRPDAMDEISIGSVELNNRTTRRLQITDGVLAESIWQLWLGGLG